MQSNALGRALFRAMVDNGHQTATMITCPGFHLEGVATTLTTIRQALHLMGRESRRRGLLLLFLSLGISLLEIVAAALIYMMLGLVANPTGTVNLPMLGDIHKLAGSASQHDLLIWLAGIMIAFFVVRALILMVAEYVLARAVHGAAARLSVKLVRGYLGLPFAFHLRRNSSELIRNAHQVTLDVANSVFNPMIRICAELVLTAGMLALLIAVSPLGTALAVAVVGGTTAIILLVVQPRLRRIGQTAHAMHKDTLASLQESFAGVKDIKVLGREESFARAYGTSRRRLTRMMYIQSSFFNLPRVAMETSLILFILVFFGVTVARGSESQQVLSVLGLFAYAGLRLQPSLQRVVTGVNLLRYSSAATSDLYRDLRTIESAAAGAESSEPFPFERELRLQGVSFSYEDTEREAVAGADLVIQRGEQIGICGPTGGGKSTLVDLIAGLLAPTSGQILVDGQDISSNTRGWQRNLGMVPQMVFLVDDTLSRNIALGIDDGEVDQTALREATHLAQLDSFIGSLPQGLETVVGERGVRISGGERQRIAIARALYHHPQVLIFDEGTSALDNTTERELVNSLRRLRGNHTIILVAHRLSTVRDADRVVFVKDGRIAAVDTFERLMSRDAAFREMAAAN